MEKHSTVRTVYLYIFAMVGLALLIIGGVRFIDMGLQSFVFTQAEEESRLYVVKPPVPPYPISKIENLENEEALSEEEKTAIKRWLVDYDAWQEQALKIDPITARRHRDASTNLALLLVGLPLYIYHWRVIKKETNKKEKEESRASGMTS